MRPTRASGRSGPPVLLRVVLGTDEAKSRLAQKLTTENRHVDWEGVDLKALNEARREAIVSDELAQRKLGPDQINHALKGGHLESGDCLSPAQRINCEQSMDS